MAPESCRGNGLSSLKTEWGAGREAASPHWSGVGVVGDDVERGLDRVGLGVQVLDPPAPGLKGSVRGNCPGDETADLGELAADDRDLVCLELGGVGAELVAVWSRPDQWRPAVFGDDVPQAGQA